MNFTADNIIEIKKDIVFRSNKDGSFVVMKLNDDDSFYKINGVAAEMWQKFSEKKNNLGIVCQEISCDYSMEPNKIILDAQVFLNKILELDLINLS